MPLDASALPPLYASTWETLLALELLSTLEPPLPLGAVVHASTTLLLPRPIRRGETVRCRLELERTSPARDGLTVEVGARNWTAAGDLRTESRHVFRVRTGAGGRGSVPREPISSEGWSAAADWALPGSAGRRFARVSGDWNPIHLWPFTARPLGFRRPVLHGFCTAAMAAHRICELLWGGETSALRRLEVAFRSPLPLPQRARLWIREEGKGCAFRVTDAGGERLFAEGSCGGGRSAP